MKHKIIKIKIRSILNSGGELAAEAEISFQDGGYGRASAPVAILPGRRELPRTIGLDNGKSRIISDLNIIVQQFVGLIFANQQEFDDILKLNVNMLGSDVCLSLSLAFARASASKNSCTLVSYISRLANTRIKMPFPLVAIFSGGIHNEHGRLPFQQIMLAVKIPVYHEALIVIRKVYGVIEDIIRKMGILKGYSSSSGMITDGLDINEMLKMVAGVINQLGYGDAVGIAIDVAAEHLREENGMYNFYNEKKTTAEMIKEYINICNTYPIVYLEDPFDPDEVYAWRELMKNVKENILIVGDDLFATNAKYIDVSVADGILIKMNQAGTLSATIRAIDKAKSQGITLCVSHRSLETEDTFMCDLAVAIGADFIKLGGPRRGDRTLKYNRLIRLEEEFCKDNLSESY